MPPKWQLSLMQKGLEVECHDTQRGVLTTMMMMMMMVVVVVVMMIMMMAGGAPSSK